VLLALSSRAVQGLGLHLKIIFGDKEGGLSSRCHILSSWCIMESHASLQAKVSGFVPGVDMVDGKCDIETAHYFLQIFADGDVYTVRRTAISFVELDRDLMKRFPKLALPVLPIYSLAGASKLKKAKRSTTSDKFGKDVLVAVDDLMTLQPMLTSYICSLMAIEPVLACDEMRTFMVGDLRLLLRSACL